MCKGEKWPIFLFIFPRDFSTRCVFWEVWGEKGENVCDRLDCAGRCHRRKRCFWQTEGTVAGRGGIKLLPRLVRRGVPTVIFHGTIFQKRQAVATSTVYSPQNAWRKNHNNSTIPFFVFFHFVPGRCFSLRMTRRSDSPFFFSFSLLLSESAVCFENRGGGTLFSFPFLPIIPPTAAGVFLITPFLLSLFLCLATERSRLTERRERERK